MEPTGVAAGRRPRPDLLADVRQILLEDRHLEIVGFVAVLIVHVNEAEELFAEIDFHAVVLLGARAHVEGAVVEFDLQVFLQLDDLGMVQVFNSATNKVRHNRLCAAPGNPGTRLFTDRCGEFETGSARRIDRLHRHVNRRH